MSSQAQQSSEAEISGSHSSARGAIPSHPVDVNDSDMEEASRSVSPEPHTQHKAATQGAAGRTQSNLSNSTYPPGYSADGIPPEISPVLLTDKVTSTERVAIAEHQPLSTESATTDLQQDSAIQHPTALKAAVPSRTDHGISDASTEGTTNSLSESQPQPSTPSSPSKSSSFFSRVLGSFMPGSTPAASETSEQGRYLNQAPSASWGKSPESEAVEEARQAGTFRAHETGLDEPTATKQAGLESGSGGSNYGRSSPTTAVAAAESLADTKTGAHHDTVAAAGHYAPQSPGRSESEYYGTPQASPDKGSSQYADEDVHRTAQHATHGNHSGQSQGYNQSQGASQNYSNPQGQSYGSDSVSQGEGTGMVDKLKSAVGMGSSTTEAGSQASNQGYNQGASQGSSQAYSSGTNQGYSQGGNQGYTQGSNHGFSSGRPAWAAAATSSAAVSEQAPAQEHKYGQPYGQSDMARNLSAAQGSREYDNTDSFKTAPSSESYGGHQADTATGSTGIVGTVLNAVGLGGGDDTVTPTATHTQRDSSPTRSPGVFGQLKDAVGLGDSNTNTAVGATSGAPTSQPAAPPTQEHKYGQPYGESEMARNLSSAQPSTGYTGSSQQQGQGTGVLDKLKSAVGVGSGTTAQTEGTNQGYSQGDAGRFSSSRPAWATSGTTETAVSQPAASQERNYGRNYGESDSSRSLSSAQPTGGYTGSAQSQGEGTGVVDKLKPAVGVGSGSSTGTGTGTGTESYGKDYSQAWPAVATAQASEAPGSGQGSVQEHKYGQPYGESEMFQKLSAAQQSKQDSTSSDQYTRPNTGYTDGSQTQGQGTGFVDKLKSAVGIGSGTADSTEAVTGSGFSASHNPIYDSDTPRSGAGYQTTRTLQPAPPSASWGTAKTSYAPTTGISQGGNSSSAGTGAAGTASQSAYLGSSASGAAATESEGAYSGNKVDSSNYQGSTPAQDSGAALSKESSAKGSLFVEKGRALEQPTQAPSTGLPKTTDGIRGKTPVQESSKAFNGEVPSGTSAGQGTSKGQGISTGQGTAEAGPAKPGTTASEHASTRSPGSPMARTGAAADQSAGQAGQPEPPVVLGTTVFEHALARTSGAPLSRAPGTPSSPPSSFNRQPGAGAAGLASGGSTAMQGSGRTTSELPVSTNAPPASARSTQESPAEAAAASRSSQGTTQPGAIKEEPIAEGKASGTEGSKGLTEGSRPVTEGNKALAEEKKAASTVTPHGATGVASGSHASPTTAAETRAAGATQPSSAATQPAGAAKKQGIAGCFACFGGQSAKE